MCLVTLEDSGFQFVSVTFFVRPIGGGLTVNYRWGALILYTSDFYGFPVTVNVLFEDGSRINQAATPMSRSSAEKERFVDIDLITTRNGINEISQIGFSVLGATVSEVISPSNPITNFIATDNVIELNYTN